MSWFQNMFDPNTSAYNAKVKAANRKALSTAMAKNNIYRNKGVAFKSAKAGAVIDKSIADSNVYTQALQNQYAAFQGFEEFARAEAGARGPTGDGSRAAERGRTASYMALLAKRQDIEHGLRESFGAAYHSKLHQNSVRSVNSMLAARDKLGIRPRQLALQGTRGTNWGVAAFNVAKTAAKIYAGGAAFAEGLETGGTLGGFKGLFESGALS